MSRRWLLWLLLALLVLATVAYAGITNRHKLIIGAMGSGAPPALLEAQDEGPDARWFDDYFVIVNIDPQTIAIVEPRYEQQNINYLIVGFDPLCPHTCTMTISAKVGLSRAWRWLICRIYGRAQSLWRVVRS